MTTINSVAVLDTIAATLVTQRKYTDKEQALRAIAQSAVRSKMIGYQRRIRRLQRKYGADFLVFSRALEGRATPQEEDDWAIWRSALSMLEEWQRVYELNPTA